MRQQLAVISLKRADSPLILFHRAFLLQNTETVWQLECAICRGALVECLKFHEIKSESEIFTRFGTPEISELYSFLFFFFFFVTIAFIGTIIFTLMPCHLEIARNGLRARSVLSDRNTLRFSFSSIKRLNMDTCPGRGVHLEFFVRSLHEE